MPEQDESSWYNRFIMVLLPFRTEPARPLGCPFLKLIDVFTTGISLALSQFATGKESGAQTIDEALAIRHSRRNDHVVDNFSSIVGSVAVRVYWRRRRQFDSCVVGRRAGLVGGANVDGSPHDCLMRCASAKALCRAGWHWLL